MIGRRAESDAARASRSRCHHNENDDVVVDLDVVVGGAFVFFKFSAGVMMM